MSPATDRLASLVASLADGWPLDMAALERSARDEPTRRSLRGLQTLAAIAGFHREAAPAQPRTRPTEMATPTAENAAAAIEGVASDESPQGESWSRFRLLGQLGRGAYGEVYRALDTQLDREVALKLLKPCRSCPEQTQRILAEARMLAQVRHPNVVSVYGAGEEAGRAGFWMELVHGITLEELLRLRGPCSAGEAALVGLDLCRGLAALHGARLLHRDVKTTNVMREVGGRIVLMDLGAGGVLGRTQDLQLVGTPLFTAPEVCSGADASVASDLYSLGVVLFRLVTAEYPRRVGGPSSPFEIRHGGETLSLHDLRPELPDVFVAVVEQALCPAPAGRPASAGAMRTALGTVLGAATAPAPGA
jgi:serine/threonine protein kinase